MSKWIYNERSNIAPDPIKVSGNTLVGFQTPHNGKGGRIPPMYLQSSPSKGTSGEIWVKYIRTKINNSRLIMNTDFSSLFFSSHYIMASTILNTSFYESEM